MLTVCELVSRAQLCRDVEGDGSRVLGECSDARDLQGVEDGVPSVRAEARIGGYGSRHRTQWALKWSNGSRQARQVHNDLHAVEPNLLSSRVSGDPQCGQRTDS